MADIVDFKEQKEKRDKCEIDNYKMERRPICFHRSKKLNLVSRVVLCNECNTSLDIFDCLAQLVRERESCIRIRDNLNGKIAEMATQITLKKKELKSLDAKIKRRKTKK